MLKPCNQKDMLYYCVIESKLLLTAIGIHIPWYKVVLSMCIMHIYFYIYILTNNACDQQLLSFVRHWFGHTPLSTDYHLSPGNSVQSHWCKMKCRTAPWNRITVTHNPLYAMSFFPWRKYNGLAWYDWRLMIEHLYFVISDKVHS